MENKTFKVWIRYLDGNGDPIGIRQYPKEYKSISAARNRADRIYNDNSHVEVEVGVLNPFETHTKEAECEICKGRYDMPLDPEFGYENYSCVSLVSRISQVRPNRKNIDNYAFKKICPSCVRKIDGYLKYLAENPTRVASNSCEAMCMDD